MKAAIAAGTIGILLAVSGAALAQKSGGILRIQHFDSPASMSILEEATRAAMEPNMAVMNNLVIASLLRGVQQEQDTAVAEAQTAKKKPSPVMIIIEEAHEFLSAERIKAMPSVFQQVAQIAKRGRKRWLGLTFVTQLPQHLPDEVLGLLNNWVLHKITDTNVIARLRRSITGLDPAQWNTVPGLAQGQAVVSYTSMTRPLLVSVDPSPSHVRMTD